MPEGDEIYRHAVRLRQDILGERLQELFVRHRGAIEGAEGARVDRIVTRGKHTLVYFESRSRAALHIHLGMNGRWSRADRGAKRPNGRDMAGAIISTETCEWRCIHPMKAEVLEGDAISSHRTMSRLGPDLLANEVDWNDILSRARQPRYARQTIADVVLIQSIAAGIGTIYRSESLFAARQNPWAPVMAIADEQIVNIYQHAKRMLSMNLVPGRPMKTTSPGGRRPIRRELDVMTYVYVRAGLPCLECGAEVEVRRHSDDARKTYYCRHCQIEEPRNSA